ncbi:hypothetical protein HD554DRAFT_2020941, partial [Boletus coccyginus]
CAIPVFEGLIPEPHNGRILHLLFLLCHWHQSLCSTWHALAKPCLHTDDTLKMLNSATVELANDLQAFVVETCPEFTTKEPPQEHWKTQEKLLKSGLANANPMDCTSASTSVHLPKALNLQTYKLHALGDYTTQICFFEMMDSYSMQLVTYLDC